MPPSEVAGTYPGGDPPAPRSRSVLAGLSCRGEHALVVLELPRVLEHIAGRATSEVGAARVRALRPLRDRESCERALESVEQMGGLLRDASEWSPGPIPDLRDALRRLGVTGAVLGAESLAGAGTLLATSRAARGALRARAETAPRLAELAAGLLEDRDLEDRLGHSFDDTGAVADGASRELARLRRELRTRRAALVERLQRLVAGLPESLRVADASVTIRNGRYCVPVRREGRRTIGGIVHDESASRQTLFVEPPSAIEPMNEIRERELAEAREEERVLRALSDALRPRLDDLQRTLDTLAEVDALWARARYAAEHAGQRPRLGPAEGRGPYDVVGGRHPLLLAAGDRTVPFDLRLNEAETLLLVSGPNAGGKTVLLKAVGLLAAMAQSGIVPPVEAGTVLPLFGEVFAVIGDEQSIEASLSTFSAHVGNLSEILEHADRRSLVLVDEIGSHTDPAEGSALAAAVLTQLAERAALTVATTHLGALKALAAESQAIVNASLEFDSERLQPSFRLTRDRPGRSYALQIAERLGLPAGVLAEARSRLSDLDLAMDELLARLESRESELARLTRQARERESEQQSERTELAARRTTIEERERELEREARRAEQKYLLDARRRIEEAVRKVEAEYAAATDAVRAAADRETAERAGERRKQAGRAARATVERALREARARPDLPAAPGERPALRPGSVVRIRDLDRRATVEEVRGDRVVLDADGLRLTVSASALEAVTAGEASAPAAAGGSPTARSTAGGGTTRAATGGAGAEESRPEIAARPEVHLRGLRVEEVEAVLVPALDAAIFADLPTLRIIHGKGTGALRDRVRQLLQSDPRVPGFRPGEHGEGGSGVTVVEFQPATRAEDDNE